MAKSLKAKWYHKINFLFLPLKKTVVTDNGGGTDMTITAYYKVYKGQVYSYKETFKLTPQTGRVARKLRRRNANSIRKTT